MKYTMIFALLFYVLSPLYALEGELVKVDGIFLNSLKRATEASIKVRWGEYENEETLHFQRHTRTDFVFNQLNAEELEQLRAILKKYLEWHEKAFREKVMLTKVIDVLKPTGKLKGWYQGGAYHFTGGMDIYFKFASSDPESHYLVIYSLKLMDIRNEYISYDPEIIFLEKAEVLKLYEALSPGVLSRTINAIRAQKAVEDTFN